MASTRLAFVSKIDGVKQVVVSDYDGFHRSQVTRDSTISMMPVWMHGNAGLVYVNFKTRRPRLYAKKFGGSERPLFAQFDQTYSPAVNPRTGELLFSSTVDGKSDLYLGNIETGKIAIEPGAEFSGNCKMRNTRNVAPQAAPQPERK